MGRRGRVGQGRVLFAGAVETPPHMVTPPSKGEAPGRRGSGPRDPPAPSSPPLLPLEHRVPAHPPSPTPEGVQGSSRPGSMQSSAGPPHRTATTRPREAFDPDPATTLVLQLLRLAHGSPALHRESRTGPGCPRCGAGAAYRWGSYSGRQRYRCRSCRTTFSDLTGSPFQHARDLGSWLPFLECMAHGCSLRDAARHCRISLSTAFRRRHRILSWRRHFEQSAPPLGGCVGLHELRMPESFKGSRVLPRPPRRRALPWRERFRGGRTALVLVFTRRPLSASVGSRSRGRMRGRMRVRVAGTVGRPPEASILRTCLEVNLRGSACVHPAISPAWDGWPMRNRQPPGAGETSGCRSAPPVTQGTGMPTTRLPGVQGDATSVRLQLRRWLPRFRGVSTRYLPNYLAWFEAWTQAFPDDGAIERWSLGLIRGEPCGGWRFGEWNSHGLRIFMQLFV